MGGKAFSELKTIRLNNEQFNFFATSCLLALESKFPDCHFEVIKSYNNKDSFGDLDILWCGPHQSINQQNTTLQAIKFIKNGPVTSFAVPFAHDDIFQVDLIHVDSKHLESASSYFAYNDLGNLLGRIFHRAGFKLGHQGMLYVLREEGNENHALKEIEVTASWKEALEFAGYDFTRWTQGFDDLEDVFKYAVSIPIASRIIFRLDETNHAARVRDRKRLTYQKFLTWINDPINAVKEYEDMSKQQLRKEWLERAMATFPNFALEVESARKDMEMKRQANEKFNGLIVQEITGLKGKELGRFMLDFIQHFIEEKMNLTKIKWALNTNSEQIHHAIKNWHLQGNL